MNFIKLCVCITATLLLRDCGVVSGDSADMERACMAAVDCNQCLSTERCLWCISQFDGDNAFGLCDIDYLHCSETLNLNHIFQGEYSPVVQQKSEFANCPNGMENDHIIDWAFKLPKECFRGRGVVCNYFQTNPVAEDEAIVFDICFTNNSPNCATTHRIGSREYRVTKRTEADYICEQYSSCGECKGSLIRTGYDCVWCVRGIGNETHFGHCVDSVDECESGDETDRYLTNKTNEANITDVTWTASSKDTCEGGLAFDDSLKKMQQDECFRDGHMVCHFFNFASHKEFDVCFMRLNETLCRKPAYRFNGANYNVHKRDPPCNEYLTCNECRPIRACTWCVVRFDEKDAFGRCIEKNDCSGRRPSPPTLKEVNVTLHDPGTCANVGMIDSHAVGFAIQAECLPNYLLCNFAEVSSNTGTEAHVFDMCFQNSRSNCPTTHRIGSREYRVTERTEADYRCERYSSCRECKSSLIRTGYNCVWCVRGIGRETPFGRCIDSEEEC